MNRRHPQAPPPAAPPSPEEGSSAERLPYRPPRLREYGRLAEVTQFGGSEIVDSGSGLGDLA